MKLNGMDNAKQQPPRGVGARAAPARKPLAMSRYRFDIKRMNADCEANYLRLCRLLPSLGGLAADARQGADQHSGQFAFEPLRCELWLDMPSDAPAVLAFNLLEQSRFTSTLQLAMQLDGGSAGAPTEVAEFGNNLSVMLTVRMYHDLRLAEVIAMGGVRAERASYDYPNATMLQPDEKAQQNLFLAELLGLALQRGRATALTGLKQGPAFIDLLKALVEPSVAAGRENRLH